MTDQITLNADLRERTGSNKAREIRKVDGMVPAIVYGDEKETVNIKLKLNELTKASENELFYTQVLLIKTEGNEEKVVLKELQKDPAKGKFLHADFQRVSRKTKLKVVIPVNFINEDECLGIKEDGGVVVDVKEGKLVPLFTQDDEDGVPKVQHFGHVKEPHEVRQRRIFSVVVVAVRVNRVVVTVRDQKGFYGHVRTEHDLAHVVNEFQRVRIHGWQARFHRRRTHRNDTTS